MSVADWAEGLPNQRLSVISRSPGSRGRCGQRPRGTSQHCGWGESFNDDAVVLNEGLLQSLYRAQERILGELPLQAHQRYAEGPHFLFMQQIYNLTGDPATVLH